MGLVFASTALMSGEESLSALMLPFLWSSDQGNLGSDYYLFGFLGGPCLSGGTRHGGSASTSLAVAFRSPLVHVRICGFVPGLFRPTLPGIAVKLA